MRHGALAGISSIVLISGCMMQTEGSAAKDESAPAKPRAVAELIKPDGSRIGMATLTEDASGLAVDVSANGLMPGGVHGLHIHTVGRCDAPDFTSAGGHWNPTGMKHGTQSGAGPHMGDMPNLTVGADGTGRLSFSVRGATLQTGDQPLLDADGAAIILHSAGDDYRTDPAGNSGARIACGIIRLP